MVIKMKYERVLIQTEEASIVFGDFKGQKDQELFRCPRKLEDTDLRRYVNENNCLLGFESDDKQETALNEIPGYSGYYRLYFRDGWYGRWMEEDDRIDQKLCAGIDEIVRFLQSNFPYGCNDWDMAAWLRDEYPTWGGDNRFLLKPLFGDHYRIAFDTTYGNGDYPVRIYVYAVDPV